MDIIIGRESGTTEPRLCLKMGNITKYVGEIGSVPKSVSRSHCLLVIDDNKTMTISNISDQNFLFVNGLEYKSKAITKTDLIELGSEKYRIDLTAILNAFAQTSSKQSASNTPKTYNITPLRNIWNNYNQAKLDIQIKERKVNALSAIPGVISMISIAMSFIEGLRSVFIVVAAVFAVGFAIMRIKSASNTPLIQRELEEKFQDDYVCPHCNHFLGNQRYELILRNGGCPWCKSKFTE